MDLLARTEYGELLPAAIQTRSLECYEISRLFVSGADEEVSLRRFFGSYACIYSWMGSAQQNFVRNLGVLSEGQLRIFPFRPFASRVHMTDYFLSCVGEGHPVEILLDIPIRSETLAWRRRFWRQSGLEGKKVLILSPGSGAIEKNWPPEFYIEVAEWWEKKIGGESVVLWGPVEEERAQNGDPWGRARVVRGLELAKAAALIRQSDLYLGNDSGATHLAAVLGIETVALFGPTDPVQWAPRGKRVTVITQSVECSPCLPPVMKSCPHRKCLTTLSPGNVIHRLGELLEMRNG